MYIRNRIYTFSQTVRSEVGKKRTGLQKERYFYVKVVNSPSGGSIWPPGRPGQTRVRVRIVKMSGPRPQEERTKSMLEAKMLVTTSFLGDAFGIGKRRSKWPSASPGSSGQFVVVTQV